MKLSPGEIISLVSVLLMLVFNLISQWHFASASSKGETEQLTRLSMQIAEIQRGVDEIKSEVKDMKEDIRTDHDSIIILQRDVKTLFHNLEERGAINNED